MKNNEKWAIFYQTISFCLPSKYAQHDEDIFNYVEKLKTEISYQDDFEKPTYSFTDSSNQFPKEWTVVQLCKNFNPVAPSSTGDDKLNYNTGISMTIFKHSALKDSLMIELKKLSENIFEKVYQVDKRIRESLNYSKMPQETKAQAQESKEKYWNATKDIELHIQESINLLKSLIGPWICALTGNFRSRKSVDTENEIRRKVNEFLKTRELNEQQDKLIHLLARRTDLLTHQQIFVAITYILRDKANIGYNDVDLNDLYDLITWIKQEFIYVDVTTHPCILIIDDLLDQMPFEMLNTQQEFTRVCSFDNLKKLYERHCGSMENGYIQSATDSSYAVVNPDGSLIMMAERMKNFFNYWLPSWKLLINTKPIKDEFYEILAQHDVFVYCGHGSGLQLCDNSYSLKSKAVVFLFGCGSVSLTSTALNSPMKGAHVFYHLGGSPAVVGFLWTVSDFATDLCSSKILSAWCNSSQNKTHWQNIDRVAWKKKGTASEISIILTYSR